MKGSGGAGSNRYLAWLSKGLCIATLGLIFLGGEVKSREAGLSVPDWPTSFGENMFTFPPSSWVGNIFYEHVHRLAASGVGLLTVVLCISLFVAERRMWVKGLGVAALLAVIAQGVLGGLTVLLLLPPAVSIAHGVLAQTFFVLTLVLAYSLSVEWRNRRRGPGKSSAPGVAKLSAALAALVFAQLFAGAVVRHSGAGLALPDFPRMGNQWMPWVNNETVAWVNAWRADAAWQHGVELPPVSAAQVWVSLIHRVTAGLILVLAAAVTLKTLHRRREAPRLFRTALYLDVALAIQVTLGAWTVLSMKTPLVTSAHVVMGAATLAFAVLLVLRAAPVSARGAALVPDSLVSAEAAPA